MVERADKIWKTEGVCVSDVFDAARHRAQEIYLKTVGLTSDGSMVGQAMEGALWGARGVIDRWLEGDRPEPPSADDLTANIVRGNDDVDGGSALGHGEESEFDQGYGFRSCTVRAVPRSLCRFQERGGEGGSGRRHKWRCTRCRHDEV